MYSTEAYASTSLGSPFERITIQRNECGAEDVEFDIMYCGICHTDLHITMNHTGSTKYPIVPGHELAGVVRKVGKVLLSEHLLKERPLYPLKRL